MRRRLFDALCLLSLACALAVAALGVRSVWWASDTLSVGLPSGYTRLSVSSACSALLISARTVVGPTPVDSGEWRYERFPATGTVIWRPDYFSGIGGPTPLIHLYDSKSLHLPAWLALLACLVLPLTRLVLARRARRRRAARLCSRCGYDLRATPGPTCPECGQPTPAPAPTRPPQPQPRPSEPAASARV